MRDRSAVSPYRRWSMGLKPLRLRVGLAVALAAAAAMFGPAVASAQVTSVPATSALRCDHPCSDPPPGGGWRYVDNYFWASSCIAAGNRGIDNGLWARYECFGSTWTNYDLWVHQ